MSDSSEDASRRPLAAALYRVCQALARLCLKSGLTYEAFAEIAKHAFVRVAQREFRIPGRKPSASRVAILTGLHRKDVARMLAKRSPADPAAEARIASAERVIAGWRRDGDFRDARGRTDALSFDGAGSTFSELVRRYAGGDLPARAVLDELARVDAVERLRDGRIRLVARAYVPSRASAEAVSIFGTDVSDLISTIDHNLEAAPGAGYFQRRVAYDNLPAEAVPEIHSEVRREGQALLERLDRLMRTNDRDANPASEGTGRRRAMAGVYFFVDDVEPDEEDPS